MLAAYLASLLHLWTPQAVRKMADAKKLETTLNYDSAFGDGGQK